MLSISQRGSSLVQGGVEARKGLFRNFRMICELEDEWELSGCRDL